MIRGSTPEFMATLTGYDLTDKRIYLTIEQHGQERFTLTNEDVEITVDTSGETPVSTIALELTQEQTLALEEGLAHMQMRIIERGGHVDPTEIATLYVGRTLNERVISYDATGSSS